MAVIIWSGDTELCKSAEGEKLVPSKIANGFIETDHTFLNNVLAVGADQKVLIWLWRGQNFYIC